MLTLYYVVVEITMSLIEQISFVHCCDSGTMDYSWSIGLWITINCLESDLKMPCKMSFECLLKSWYVGLLTTLSLCWLMCAVREVGHRLYCVSAKKCGVNLAMIRWAEMNRWCDEWRPSFRRNSCTFVSQRDRPRMKNSTFILFVQVETTLFVGDDCLAHKTWFFW